jgi:hypothetical protein
LADLYLPNSVSSKLVEPQVDCGMTLEDGPSDLTWTVHFADSGGARMTVCTPKRIDPPDVVWVLRALANQIEFAHQKIHPLTTRDPHV